MRSVSALALLAVAALLSGCEPSPPRAERASVVATIFPLGDLLARMAGGAVPVETLLPPRASPATWEAAPRQIRTLSRARGVVSVGAGLDAWVEELIPSDRDLPRLRITDGLALRATTHDHGPAEAHPEGEAGDPHVWLDPLLVRDRILPRMEAFLSALAPDHATGIGVRAAALADSLTALDAEIRAVLAEAPGRRFVATHDAWTYFAGAYGLESVGSVYERPGHEPSVRGLARLVRAARAAGLASVLAEPQLAATAARALAAELGVGVTVVDPLGGPGLDGRESYFEMMRFNARAFREALGGP